MSEQRKAARKKLMSFTPVYDLQNNLLGYLGNLTLQGAMVVGNKPIEANKVSGLVIEFHGTPETPAARMVIPTRVAWCKREEYSPYYNTGFEFLELTDQDKMVISSILARYEFHQDMPR